jgi:hypothetical protein
MSDHWATWVRLREEAWEWFPDDEVAAEIAAREAFDAEEMAAYAADLDAQVEAHVILDTAHGATRLRDEFHKELRAEGSGAGDNRNKEEYVHLDDDDLTYLELPTDEEAAEAAAEQRALMASYEMQRHNESTYRLMTAKRRAVDRMAVAQQRGLPLGSPPQHGRGEGGEGSGKTAPGGGGGEGEGGNVGEGESTSTLSPPLTCTRMPSAADARFMRTTSAVA